MLEVQVSSLFDDESFGALVEIVERKARLVSRDLDARGCAVIGEFLAELV